jgi:uncharacterized DUF497 family protein
VPFRYGYCILRDADDPERPAFEFDAAKSAANREKHGIDVVAAQALWLDDRRVEVAARVSDEPRRLLIGRIGHRHWAAVFAWRGDRVRVISVRRARFREVALYESEKP